jgi:hypothetical protein
MLDSEFYNKSNNRRIQEINVSLKNINIKILEEEKNWEGIFEKIEMSNK